MNKSLIALATVTALTTSGCWWDDDKECEPTPSNAAAIEKHSLGTTVQDTDYREFLRIRTKLGVDDGLFPSDQLTAKELETLQAFEDKLEQEIERFGDFPVGHIVEEDLIQCVYDDCVSNASTASYLAWLDATHKTAVKYATQMRGVAEQTKAALLEMPALIELEDADITLDNEHVAYIAGLATAFKADGSLEDDSEMKVFIDAVNKAIADEGFATLQKAEIKAFVGKAIDLLPATVTDQQKTDMKAIIVHS